MVMTTDGIVAAAALGPDLEEDVVAALASGILTSARTSLRPLAPEGTLGEFVLAASDGKMVFVEIGNGYLVVVAKRDMELDTTMVEIQSAAHHIKNRGTHLALQRGVRG
jgi:predicted regulator of Ras-like GTPase activity (Roadblock/LC7/MglB family)